MIFIRPKIMRDANQAAYETDLKYNYMLDQQHHAEHLSPNDIPPLLPGVPQGHLPPLPPPPPPGTDAATGQPSKNVPGGTVPPHGANGAPPPTGTAAPPGTPVPDATATPAPQTPPDSNTAHQEGRP
jgi:hypothetical protein